MALALALAEVRSSNFVVASGFLVVVELTLAEVAAVELTLADVAAVQLTLAAGVAAVNI